MPLSRRKKALIWVVLGLYGLFVGAFLVKTLFLKPGARRDWARAVAARSREYVQPGQEPPTRGELREIFDRYLSVRTRWARGFEKASEDLARAGESWLDPGTAREIYEQHLKDRVDPAWVEMALEESARLPRPEVKALTEADGRDVYDAYVAEKGQIIGLNYTMVMQMLNFAVFLLAVYLLGWQPMIEFLDQRRARVRDDIESARKAREAAEADRREAVAALREARQRRAHLRERAAHEAEQDRRAILEKAQHDAERLLAETRERLAAEAEAARVALQREVGDLAVRVAGRVLERELRKEDHERLVAEAIAELERG